MTYPRPQKPDVFELMIFAWTRVFVRIDDQQYLVVSALQKHLSILTFCDGSREPVSVRYSDETAQELGLFDGAAWNLPALVTWLNNISPDNDVEER